MTRKKKIAISFVAFVVVAACLGFGYRMYAGATLSDSEKLEMSKKFAPKIMMHRDEKYFPDNVENWFKATELRYLTKDTRNRVGGIIVIGGDVESALVQKNVTAENLANSEYDGAKSNSDGKFFLNRVVDSAMYGDNQGEVDAPVYVLFYEGDDHVEITYKLWYPHNGNMADNIPLVDGASHQGDWEAVTVIVDKAKQQITSAMYNAHADETQFYIKDELQFEGNHPIVYSGKDSHASYSLDAATKTGDHDWKIDRPGGTNPYVPDDHITNNGKAWSTWNNVVMLGKQPWLNYRGRWGAVSTEYLDGPYGPYPSIGSRLGEFKNRIIFYQRDNCIGHMRGTMNANTNITYNIKEEPPSGITKLANDAIRSLRVVMMNKDTLIRLYDSPDGSKSDDYVEIFVKRDMPSSVKINNIEKFMSNEDVLVLPHYYNGLSGKISRIEVVKGVAAPKSVARFYEGNNATQDLVGTLDLSNNANIALKNSVIENDEIRSMIINSPKGGTLMTVYDDPDGKTTDDWAEVYIKKDGDQIQVDTFEKYVDADGFRVVPHYVNGLDGKISYIRVNTRFEKLPDGSIMFYEGNNCTQDLLGTFNVQYTRVNLKQHKMDNDEARSMCLKNVIPGTVIRVFDSPDGSWNDDVCTITVKKYVGDYDINTFEKSFEDEFVKVEFHKKNGLDGKVSRIEIN